MTEMSYRNLGSSGLKVSVVGLGTNNFGFKMGEEESRAVVAAALLIRQHRLTGGRRSPGRRGQPWGRPSDPI